MVFIHMVHRVVSLNSMSTAMDEESDSVGKLCWVLQVAVATVMVQERKANVATHAPQWFRRIRNEDGTLTTSFASPPSATLRSPSHIRGKQDACSGVRWMSIKLQAISTFKRRQAYWMATDARSTMLRSFLDSNHLMLLNTFPLGNGSLVSAILSMAESS